MVRRGITTLLMMAFLANQSAVVPHAHGACAEAQPPDHDARPHIHISWFDHVGHSGHDGHANDDEHDAGHSQPCSFQSFPGHDHDSDAIYLSTDAGVSLPVKSVVAPNNFQVVATFAVAATPIPTAISDSWAAADFPDKCSLGCPIYLALR